MHAWFPLWALLPLGVLVALPADAQETAKDPAYRAFPLIGSRLAVWTVAQLHLNSAAFILGAPVFPALTLAAFGRP